ncbi:MAG: hypothetical protein OER86_13545 [Phycisphaerae bacterium]|nr:hypothetical protein [Phycisphaerae bacterium]
MIQQTTVNNGICLMSREPDTVQAVTGALEALGTPRVSEDLGALGQDLEQSVQPAALVDIDPDPTGTLARLEPLITRFADTRFVVLCNDSNRELLLEAMHAGARHLVLKEGLSSELAGVVRKVLGNGHTGSGSIGSVVTVLSAGGGVGATTVAVNLARELHSPGGAASLLIDLDDCYGAAGAYLGLQGSYGIVDALSFEGELDPELIRSTVMRYSDELHALISPVTVSFDQPKPLDLDALGPVLATCRRAYPWVVVDAPRVPLDVGAGLARDSETTLIVCQLTVKDLRVARSMRLGLTRRGVDGDQIIYVVNRYHRRGQNVSLDDAQETLDGGPVHLVRNDYGRVATSHNFGKLLCEDSPRGPARRDLEKLAQELREDNHVTRV